MMTFSLAVAGKWRITSICAAKRRRGFALVVISGVLFNSLLLYSGLYFSAAAGVVLIAIDARGYLHNA